MKKQLLILSLLITQTASAQGLPWEGPLQTIEQSISGPVARALAILAIVITGLGIAFSEGGTGLRNGTGLRKIL